MSEQAEPRYYLVPGSQPGQSTIMDRTTGKLTWNVGLSVAWGDK
jgi:hypothetical protein